MRIGRSLLLAAPVLAAATVAAAAPGGSDRLPPDAVRGPAHGLQPYPAVGLATPAERAAARQLLARLRTTTRAWRDPAAAAEAGFRTVRPRRKPGERRIMWFHAEHRGFSNDRSFANPEEPEVLIYADMPGRPLVLVGVMFSVPRGVRGPAVGGPITRWHTHRVCVEGNRRGLGPRADGTCPPGTTSRYGSEMMHVWFTRDLRSAYAIHAPVHELCVARLVPRPYCNHRDHRHGM